MTIKTFFLNEAARKSNKGPTPPCVNAKPLTQRRTSEPVRPLESIYLSNIFIITDVRYTHWKG